MWNATQTLDDDPHKKPHWHAAGQFKRLLKLSFKSVWSHRLRALLTVLGIVFGVCSVIAMLAIGEGVSFEVQEQIRQLGSTNIILRSLKPPEDQSTSAERTWLINYGLTYADVERIKSTIPGVSVIVPSRIIRRNVWRGGRRIDCDIIGTVPWYTELTSRRVDRGRFFTPVEVEHKTNVCLLEKASADELFPLDDPLGKTVRVEEDYYRVVGIMAPAANDHSDSSLQPPSQETDKDRGVEGHRMFIPLTAAKSRFGEILMKRSSGSFSAERVELHEATIKVARLEDVVETSMIVSDILERHHKKMDYEIVVTLKLLRSAEKTKRIFNIVLGAIAAISLLVGGIGIMNIMLASVTERTREIGIRRALGARRRDITLQFLVETVFLSATGGVIGVSLGLAIPWFVTRFAHMKTIVTLWSPIIAFSISAVVGIVFGLYPALRAASMDPVEALRHE